MKEFVMKTHAYFVNELFVTTYEGVILFEVSKCHNIIHVTSEHISKSCNSTTEIQFQ